MGKRKAGKYRVREAEITKEQTRELIALMSRLPEIEDASEYCQGLLFHEAQWTIVELSYPRFKYHLGQWMVIGTVETVRPGSVEVHKKDGTQTHVQVKSIGRPFRHLGRMMVHGAL